MTHHLASVAALALLLHPKTAPPQAGDAPGHFAYSPVGALPSTCSAPPQQRPPCFRMAVAARASVEEIMAAKSAPCTQVKPRLENPSTYRMTAQGSGNGRRVRVAKGVVAGCIRRGMACHARSVHSMQTQLGTESTKHSGWGLHTGMAAEWSLRGVRMRADSTTMTKAISTQCTHSCRVQQRGAGRLQSAWRGTCSSTAPARGCHVLERHFDPSKNGLDASQPSRLLQARHGVCRCHQHCHCQLLPLPPAHL